MKSLLGFDRVQALLGHHTRTMSEHYGGSAVKMAAEVAKGRRMAGDGPPPAAPA